MAQKQVFIPALNCWIYVDESQDEQKVVDNFVERVQMSRKAMYGNYYSRINKEEKK